MDDDFDDDMLVGEPIPQNGLEDVPDEESRLPARRSYRTRTAGPQHELQIFAFTWEVPADGYQLVTASIGPLACRLLTNDVPRGSRYQVRVTRPLELSALFLELAQVSDDASLIRFANCNGCLGLPARTAFYEPGQHIVHGELATDWLAQAKRLRETMAAWESQRIEDVAAAISECLDGNVSPRCLPGRHPRVMFEPHHLLAALWLQFAQAVEGRKVYRRCAWTGCGKWIAISLEEDGRSERAYYCGGPCRQKAYRERVKDRIGV